MPSAAQILKDIGENIRLARKRRRLSESLMAERAGLSRSTVQLLEKGKPGVSMSSYVQILFILGLHEELKNIAVNGQLGRKLQDAELLKSRK